MTSFNINSLIPHRREDWMLLSVILNSLINISGVLSNALPYVLMIISVIIFFYILLKYCRRVPLTGITGKCYSLMIVWTIILTLHMFLFAESASFSYYFASNTFFPYLLPLLIMCFPRDYRIDLKYYWRIQWIFCIIFIILFPFAIRKVMAYGAIVQSMGMDGSNVGEYYQEMISAHAFAVLATCTIMIYFKDYLRHKKWYLYIIATVCLLFLMAYSGRRGNTAIYILYFAFIFIVNFYSNKITLRSLILWCSIILGLYYVVSGSLDSTFSILRDRAYIDSRSKVEDAFFADFNSIQDWLFGRGWMGAYFDRDFGKNRELVETGYLNLLLHGGLLLLVPYVVILFNSFRLGLFKSKNVLCKGFAVMCVMQLISLYPYGLPTFSVLHYTIWIGVFVCNSQYYRNLTDQEIFKLGIVG